MVLTSAGPGDGGRLGIAALGPTELLNLLTESGDVNLRFKIALLDRKEQTDPSHPLGQLRAHRAIRSSRVRSLPQ